MYIIFNTRMFCSYAGKKLLGERTTSFGSCISVAIPKIWEGRFGDWQGLWTTTSMGKKWQFHLIVWQNFQCYQNDANNVMIQNIFPPPVHNICHNTIPSGMNSIIWWKACRVIIRRRWKDIGDSCPYLNFALESTTCQTSKYFSHSHSVCGLL